MFEKFRRGESRSREDPYLILERMERFFKESKAELESLAKPAPRQVMVVRRELDLAKPTNLLAGLLILALGFGIGHWSKSQDYNRGYLDQLVPNESGGMMLITPGSEIAPVTEPESAVTPTPLPPVVNPVAEKDSASEHSPPDTLLQKVRDLLERVKRGE